MPARLMLGLTRPRKSVLGTELSGVIEAVGTRVTRFRRGDEVIAFSGIGLGCHAEFKTMREDGAIVHKPSRLTPQQAASISFGGTTALYFLQSKGRVRAGDRVLVNGASGTVGSAAVQIARRMGAHVTGVSSAANIALVRSLGADEALDYAAVDIAACGEQWDVVLDCVGNMSFSRHRDALTENGRLLLIVGGLGDLLKAPFQSAKAGRSVAGGTAPERAEDLRELVRLIEAGDFMPVIDSHHAFERIVDAHARADTGRKVGSVVMTFS